MRRSKQAWLALFAAFVVTIVSTATLANGQSKVAQITWYPPTGNPTASGEWPYMGSAACSYDIPMGSLVTIAQGETVRCNDTGGGLGSGYPSHIDIYNRPDVPSIYGSYLWPIEVN